MFRVIERLLRGIVALHWYIQALHQSIMASYRDIMTLPRYVGTQPWDTGNHAVSAGLLPRPLDRSSEAV